MSSRARKKILVFCSGQGRLLEGMTSFLPQMELIVDRPCPALQRATGEWKIPVKSIPRNEWLSVSDSAQANEFLQKHELAADLWVLAGFLTVIPSSLLTAISAPIVNTHPSLLPRYGGKGMYGMRVHEAVLRGQEKFSGCSVHYVTAGVDEGEVLAQARVLVTDDDSPESLAKRVLAEEKVLLAQVIQGFLQ